MAIIANRRVGLLPGWTFEPGQRVPENVWDGLGKAKQKVLLNGRFFVQKHGKAAERIPAPVFDQGAANAAALRAEQPVLPPAESRKIVVWPEYEKTEDLDPSLRELAGIEDQNKVDDAQYITRPLGPFICSDCGAELSSKQALGGHRAKHTRERRALQEV